MFTTNPFKLYPVDDKGYITVSQALAETYFAYYITTGLVRPDGAGSFLVPVTLVNQTFPTDPMPAPVVIAPPPPPPPPPLIEPVYVPPVPPVPPTYVPPEPIVLPPAPPAPAPVAPPVLPPAPAVLPPAPPVPPVIVPVSPPPLPKPVPGPLPLVAPPIATEGTPEPLPALAPPPTFSLGGYEPLSAEAVLLQSIDALLAGQDDILVLPMTQLNKGIAEIVVKNAQIVTSMMDKILRFAARRSTKEEDALDGPLTRVLQGLDAWQFDIHYLLTQLAAKGGFVKAGDPLEAALIEEALKAPELAYQGTLVLAVAEAIPYFKELIEALREIRDRMPPLALHVRGEPLAKAPVEGEAQTATIESMAYPVEAWDFAPEEER